MPVGRHFRPLLRVNQYRSIAVASTFSPRFLPVLTEAARIARFADCPLNVIHAAERDEDKAQRFRDAFVTAGVPEGSEVIWAPGESPAESIVSAIRGCGAELLIAGALERQSEVRLFTGGVSREMLRHLPSDLLLLTNPSTDLRRWRKLVVFVESDGETPHVRRALGLAAQDRAESVCLISVVTPFDAFKGERSHDEVDDRLAGLCEESAGFQGTLDMRVVRSNTGFSLCDAVQGEDADLFVVPANEISGATQLADHLDWLFQVIPTNLWVIRRVACV